MLQYMRYTVEFEVSFVKSSVNTLSFTGQFKYQFLVFSCFFILFNCVATPSQRNGFELCKVGIRSHSVLCTRPREESS